jgi:putative membrane protein
VSAVPGDQPASGVPAPRDGTPGWAVASAPRRLHPLTPAVRGWRSLAVAIAVLGQNQLRDHTHLTVWLLLYAALVPLALGYGCLHWWFTRFHIQGGEVRISSGVLFRKTRHVRVDRLQAVDVVRPVLARFAGLAELRLQAAGGGAALTRLGFLTEREAVRLRAELLARAAGVAPETPEASESVIVTVPTGVLIRSMLLSWSTVVGVAVAAGLFVVAFAVDLPGLAVGALPEALALGSAAFRHFSTHFDFTVADSADGLRLRHGLLEHRAQTVPPGRIQAIRLVEPLLWRLPGWVRVEVNVAGYVRHGEEGTSATSVLLPVAPRALAVSVIGRLLPGVDLDAIPLRPVPGRARLRRPIGARVLGCGADDAVFVTRRGWLTRQFDILPHGKTQSVRCTQGPWERLLGLATVHLDTTPGPVHVHAAHRDAAEAGRIVVEQSERARLGRRAAGPYRWMTDRG